jgi:6-phosphogluconolactonase
LTLRNLYVGTFTTDCAGLVHNAAASGAHDRQGQQSGAPWPTGTLSHGIECLVFDDDKGGISRIGCVAGVRNPQYVELHPGLPLLYAVEFDDPGRVTEFAIDTAGCLSRCGAAESLGQLPAAIGIHPSRRHAYVANWGSGTVSVIPLNASGEAGDPWVLPQLTAGSSGRPHQARATPDGSAVLVAYAGGRELKILATEEDGRPQDASASRIRFPPQAEPRHIEFHPSGRLVYVLSESDSTLYVLAAEKGVPTRIVACHSSLPVGFDGPNQASELDLHPDARSLYTGNRGHDSVAIFGLDEDGNVESCEHQPSLGKDPRAVRVDPTGQYLVVGNMTSCNLAVFRIRENRELQPVGQPLFVPSPSSVVFGQPRTQSDAC